MSARPGASLLLFVFFLAALCGAPAFLDRSSASAQTSAAQDRTTQGQLRILDAQGNPGSLCPLKHTDVKAEVSGFLAHVMLTQEFHKQAGSSRLEVRAAFSWWRSSLFESRHRETVMIIR
jgi:hypothetical protein